MSGDSDGDEEDNDVFEESNDMSLPTRKEVLALLEEVKMHQSTMLSTLANEKDTTVKGQLRDTIKSYSAIVTQIASAYLSKLAIDSLHGSCVQVINSACEKIVKTSESINNACGELNKACIEVSEVVTGSAVSNARSFSNVASASMPSSSRSHANNNNINKVILNRGKPFNIHHSRRVTIGPCDSFKEKFATSKDTHDVVLRVLNPKQLKMNIKRVVYTGNSSIILKGDSLDAGIIGDQLSTARSGLEIKSNAVKNPRLIIHDVPIELNAKDVVDCVINQNLSDYKQDTIKAVYMFPLRENKKSRSCVIEVAPEYRKSLMSKGRVYINWRSCRIADHVSILQCFKCLKFGHIKRDCLGVATCGHCSGPHESEACTNKDSLCCKNCVTSDFESVAHSAFDKAKCSVLRKHIDRAVSFINYGE